MQHRLRVSAIQRLCLQDGPGVRTTVFLKGCYLSCPWCCNPETILYDGDDYFCKAPELCGTSRICKGCEVMGGKRPKASCPLRAFVKTYTDYDVEELHSILLRDKSLFSMGGGVTLSGGEPLMQARQLVPLLEQLRADNIHIAIESSLYAPSQNFDLISEYVDYWLVDVKFQFGFISYLEKNIFLEDFANNLRFVQEHYPASCVFRMVISKQAIPFSKDIIARLKRYGIRSLELLPCHQLAENKYKQLEQLPSRYSTPEESELVEFRFQLQQQGINTNLLKL